MKLTRREFVKTSAIATAGIVAFKASLRDALAFYQSPSIPLFRTRLRGAGPGGIPVALPDSSPAPVTGVTHYTIGIEEFRDQIVPVSTMLGPTTLWGYVPRVGLGGYTQPTHLGGIIIVHRDQPIQITFQNQLPDRHPLPVDFTQFLMPSDLSLVNRTATHLHGGLVPWISDGGPFDWFDPNGAIGPSFLNNQVLNPSAPPGSAEYYYPMNQSARFMWYHDHAHGITRLNAYAGIASGMLIRDDFEAGLIQKNGLPKYIENGGNEIPLVFQDKIFVGNGIVGVDPTWTGLTDPGSLWYAHTYDPSRWDLAIVPGVTTPPPDPSVIAEFFGDTMLVNGTSYPEVTVEARRYRLRLLNACNARFLNLQLYVADGSKEGITLNRDGSLTNSGKYDFINAATGDSSFLQIGGEGGFLSKPAKVPCNKPFGFLTPPDPTTGQTDPSQVLHSLLVAPAERPDLIVDFGAKDKDGNYLYVGKQIIVYNDAAAPFPSGDDRNDYFPGILTKTNPVNRSTRSGFGPNSRVLMRFNVVAPTGGPDPTLNLGPTTDLTKGIDRPLIPWGSTTPPKGATRRFLSLNEYQDDRGRLIQIIGDADAPFGSPYAENDQYLDYVGGSPTTLTSVAPTSEIVENGATEVWEIFNTTGDVHPMHIHLVNVQLINRQLFNVADLAFNTFLGDPIPPNPNELGWKETVPMYPGTVTRFIAKFDLAQAQIEPVSGKVITTPDSPRTGGAEYVWHCHILEHEEHDMMHALIVK